MTPPTDARDAGLSPSAEPLRPLVDASTLAIDLSVSRAFVYEHAQELGALRLGSGPKARLRFDPAVARAALSRYSSEPSQAQNPSADGRSGPVAPRRSGQRSSQRPLSGPILPSRPRRKATRGAE